MSDLRAKPESLSPVIALEYAGVKPIACDSPEPSPVMALEDNLNSSRVPSGEGISPSGFNLPDPTELRRIASSLGVSVASLERLDVRTGKPGWIVPMRMDGAIVGWRLRRWKGGKETLAGGKLGLFIPTGIKAANVQAVVEGESDLPAALDLDLPAIGRPGATACVAETVRFLAPCRWHGLTIVADADDPGRDGAEQLATALVDAGHAVRVLEPPDGIKDLRAWLLSGELTRAVFLKTAGGSPWRWPAGTPPGYFGLPNWAVRSGLIREVGPVAVAVLSAVASFWGADGLCRCGRERLAELVGRSIPTVDRAVRTLKRVGLLRVVVQGGRNRENVYAIELWPLQAK